MNKPTISWLFLLLLAAAAMARPKPAASPAAAPAPTRLLTLFDFAAQLKLTNDQKSQIRQSFSALQKSLVENGKQVSVLRGELSTMMQSTEPLEQIQAKLEAIATVEIRMKMADISTSRKINSLLTPEQLEQWHQIQKTTRNAPPAKAATAAPVKAAGTKE